MKESLVWRAVADPTRRAILDVLAAGARTTGELIAQFDGLSRSAVMKHMDVLASANLLIVRRDGRTRWNHLNPAPIQHVCDRWVANHVRHHAGSLSRLKTLVEHNQEKRKMSKRNFETQGFTYELEIAIDGSREKVWQAITRDTNLWWLPDFHVTGADSIIELRAEAGGQLIERRENGTSLLWYTVHMVDPGKSIHLVGHSFPEWGGPSTTMLKIAVDGEDGEDGGPSVVRITDSLFGGSSDKAVESLREGWTTLFTDGLKRFVETGAI